MANHLAISNIFAKLNLKRNYSISKKNILAALCLNYL